MVILWPFVVIVSFWLGYLQAHLWPSQKLYSWLESHSSDTKQHRLKSKQQKQLKAKPERKQFWLDVRKKQDNTSSLN